MTCGIDNHFLWVCTYDYYHCMKRADFVMWLPFDVNLTLCNNLISRANPNLLPPQIVMRLVMSCHQPRGLQGIQALL